MNGANAALVLGCVAILLPRGLTAGAWGWTAAQGLSLLLGTVVIATGRSGRHRAVARGARQAGAAGQTRASGPSTRTRRASGSCSRPGR